MKWCKICVLPDTRPDLAIGKDGVCNMCATHGMHRDRDWTARTAMFHRVAEHAKTRSVGYDCLVALSGGKHSMRQLVTCLEAGLKPLAVTCKSPGRTALGASNLEDLVKLGVDHIDYEINPEIEKRFMLAALTRFGDPGIPMRTALVGIPLTIAVRFRIPLIVWGDRSGFESSAAVLDGSAVQLDSAWLQKSAARYKAVLLDCIGDGYVAKDMLAYLAPDDEVLAAAGTHAVFLADYFPWDAEATPPVAAAHGSRQGEQAKRGYYDDGEIDDEFMSVHRWFTWYKFGFTSLFDRLSSEIRSGRISREIALDVLRRRGDDAPHDNIFALCRFLGIGMDRFFAIAEEFRNAAVWTKRGGTWVIDDFLIADWDWR
jgi:N-acetyl sugar amidotransferase